jgi:VIT1/CCC1 family predicted Fe2+/Mn2+ transporter
MRERLLRDPLFVRNVVFGVEDSLVSTVGLLSGIAAESQSHAAILSTGVIYICVEALSMAVGSFLSEESAQEIAGKGPGKIRRAPPGRAVKLVSIVLAGLVAINT